jgi:acetyl esterase/lipase
MGKSFKVLIVMVAVLVCGRVAAAEPFVVPLYPGGVPDSNGLEGKERRRNATDGFILDVSVPELTVYLPEKGKATGRAVVICPGGGYSGVSMDNEGHHPAKWLAARGVAGIVLKYRMPNGHYDIPLADAHAAVKTVRTKAAEWGIDPAKVGIMGFSAGGHLAATASVHYAEDSRPDFSVLIYPVISFVNEKFVHSGSRRNLLGALVDTDKSKLEYFSAELQVSDKTPRAFIVFADDDKGVDPRNGTLYYDALKANKVPAEMHIYPTGGHGFGWKESFAYRAEFLGSLGRWLDQLP